MSGREGAFLDNDRASALRDVLRLGLWEAADYNVAIADANRGSQWHGLSSTKMARALAELLRADDKTMHRISDLREEALIAGDEELAEHCLDADSSIESMGVCVEALRNGGG